MDLNEFHFLVGQTIMYCQVIEHDVKRIYAAMHKGDYYENLERVDKWTLGKCVQELKKLDFSDHDPYISASDYNFLKQMTEKRNHRRSLFFYAIFLKECNVYCTNLYQKRFQSRWRCGIISK